MKRLLVANKTSCEKTSHHVHRCDIFICLSILTAWAKILQLCHHFNTVNVLQYISFKFQEGWVMIQSRSKWKILWSIGMLVNPTRCRKMKKVEKNTHQLFNLHRNCTETCIFSHSINLVTFYLSQTGKISICRTEHVVRKLNKV